VAEEERQRKAAEEERQRKTATEAKVSLQGNLSLSYPLDYIAKLMLRSNASLP